MCIDLRSSEPCPVVLARARPERSLRQSRQVHHARLERTGQLERNHGRLFLPLMVLE